MDGLIRQLEERLKQPLPGRPAQSRFAPVLRNQFKEAGETARKAAVLALFYPKKNQWHLVFIERGNHNPNDRHRGQISFPGGKLEPEDPSLLHTALRETEEEVGLPARDVRVLGEMTSLYIPASDFHVSPFVGWVDYAPTFIPEEAEVRSVLEVPLEHFYNKEHFGRKDIQVAPHLWLREVPFITFNQKVIWGATAMVLGELLELCKIWEDYPA